MIVIDWILCALRACRSTMLVYVASEDRYARVCARCGHGHGHVPSTQRMMGGLRVTLPDENSD